MDEMNKIEGIIRDMNTSKNTSSPSVDPKYARENTGRPKYSRVAHRMSNNNYKKTMKSTAVHKTLRGNKESKSD